MLFLGPLKWLSKQENVRNMVNAGINSFKILKNTDFNKVHKKLISNPVMKKKKGGRKKKTKKQATKKIKKSSTKKKKKKK